MPERGQRPRFLDDLEVTSTVRRLAFEFSQHLPTNRRRVDFLNGWCLLWRCPSSSETRVVTRNTLLSMMMEVVVSV